MENEIDKIQELAAQKYYNQGFYDLHNIAQSCLLQSVAHMYAQMKLKQAAELCYAKGQDELGDEILTILKY